MRLKFSNRNRDERSYHISLAGTPDVQLISPINPFPVPGGHTLTTTVFLADRPVRGGQRSVMFHVSEGRGFDRTTFIACRGRTTANAEGALGERR